MGKVIKNWVLGAGTVFQIQPNTAKNLRKRFLERNDRDALHEDWVKIGKDIKKSMEKYEQEQST